MVHCRAVAASSSVGSTTINDAPPRVPLTCRERAVARMQRGTTDTDRDIGSLVMASCSGPELPLSTRGSISNFSFVDRSTTGVLHQTLQSCRWLPSPQTSCSISAESPTRQSHNSYSAHVWQKMPCWCASLTTWVGSEASLSSSLTHHSTRRHLITTNNGKKKSGTMIDTKRAAAHKVARFQCASSNSITMMLGLLRSSRA